VRPTADRVREAWMSIVLPEIPGARVLDLFAGSGALGLEALSRGAAEAHFVEKSERVLRTLGENIAAVDASAQAVVYRGDALKFARALQAGAYDVAFVDPPYRLGLAAQVATVWSETPFAHLLGVEHSTGEVMPAGGDTRRYGDSSITFYRVS
jgi:16S rRNA (guanine966-N2)-methyltransferase